MSQIFGLIVEAPLEIAADGVEAATADAAAAFKSAFGAFDWSGSFLGRMARQIADQIGLPVEEVESKLKLSVDEAAGEADVGVSAKKIPLMDFVKAGVDVGARAAGAVGRGAGRAAPAVGRGLFNVVDLLDDPIAAIVGQSDSPEFDYREAFLQVTRGGKLGVFERDTEGQDRFDGPPQVGRYPISEVLGPSLAEAIALHPELYQGIMGTAITEETIEANKAVEEAIAKLGDQIARHPSGGDLLSRAPIGGAGLGGAASAGTF
jgi:hypothetical protein